MRGLCIILLATTCALALRAEQPAFQMLRYNEDWSFLRDPAQGIDLFDAAKHRPLNPNGDWYLPFGGEARHKYEFYTEPVFKEQPADDNGFLLQRFLLYADQHATPYFRVFGQLQSSLEDFRNDGPRPLAVNYAPYLLGDFVTESVPGQKNGNYISAVATYRF